MSGRPLIDLTDVQRSTQELCRDFARKQIRPVAAHLDAADHEMAWDVWYEAAKAGITSFMLPERYGGAGMRDMITSCLVHEELCWGDVGLGHVLTSHGFFGGVIEALGDDSQRERWLTPLAGERPPLTAVGATEPNAGSDLASLQTTAKKVDGGYVLNGQKSWISNAEVAEYIVVFATVAPGTRSKGITAFVLERGDPGLTIGPPMAKMGQRAMIANELFLADLFVPDDRRIGDEGQGFRGLMRVFERARTNIAAGCVGLARATYEYAHEYAQTRETFGKPIAQHQAIAFRLADMATRADAARLLVWRAARVIDAGEPAARPAAMAKVFASEAAMWCSWAAVQILGGWGYSREYPVERWMRDAKLDEIGEGTNEILRTVIARS